MKHNLLQKLLSILKSDQPEIIVDRYDQTMLRMSMIGLLDTVENIAKAGKIAVNSSTTLPTSLLRLYLNGIVNSCALAEEAMTKTKKDDVSIEKPPQKKATNTEELNPGSQQEVLETDSIDGDAFDFIVKTFKKKK